MTEYDPVFPTKEKWTCPCGVVNEYVTYTCVSCGKAQEYVNPCDDCNFCKQPKEIQIDWKVRDLVRY